MKIMRVGKSQETRPIRRRVLKWGYNIKVHRRVSGCELVSSGSG
jgi:hypothetical protein